MGKLPTLLTVATHAKQASLGRCPVCLGATAFVLTNPQNLREGYKCLRCRSLARNRLVVLSLCDVLGVRSLAALDGSGTPPDVYLAAASGPVYNALVRRLPTVSTSDFVPGVPTGAVLQLLLASLADRRAGVYDAAVFVSTTSSS
jgi:hypothetical protein